MYSLLYKSMVAHYKRRRTYLSGPYVYAAAMLSILALFNIVSVISICAHFHLTWALKFFETGKSPIAWAGVAAALFFLHVAYARRQGEPTELAPRWIANDYLLGSAALFYYAFVGASHPP